MSAGSPDLFVVCKNCHAEVSPYITECPYCGNRLRKRAPKIDRHGRVDEKRRRRPPTPSLPRLKRGEIPGIRADSHPYATMLLLAAGFAGTLLYRAAALGSTHAQLLWADNGTHLWWRLSVATFTYTNTGYGFVTLFVIGLFGWLLERRHGPLVVIALYAAGAVGGTAVAIAVQANTPFLGANGGALALLVAWAVPDLLDLRAGEEIEGDLIGAGVLAGVVAAMPLVGADASWVADGVGVAAGLLAGLGLARFATR
ncbi:MAG TPA: rhomboid family intramembrane serine protease [Solirubrobacteraceae bacterium]|nr:rhomboid family intramembrane serine protease [Solirubrobacteraceae bacterium]